MMTDKEHSKTKDESDKFRKEWLKPENQKKLQELIEEFGEYKRVTDMKTGKTYKVPTKDIIMYGLKYSDLKYYPEYDR